MNNLTHLKVIQAGFPKSGNSLLYKLISLCLKEFKVYRTYSSETGLTTLYRQLYKLHGLKELFDNYLEIDDIVAKKEGLFLYFPFPLPEFRLLPVEISNLLSSSSIIWSHAEIDGLYPFILNFGLRFYIIRDGRDTINSLIHFNTSKHILSFQPEYKIKTPDKLYERYDIFSKYVIIWKEHIESYLNCKEFFTEIRFEKLVNSGEDFLEILKIFGLEHKYGEFSNLTSFKSMKTFSSLHLRKGEKGDWENFFTVKHKEIFKDIAGDILIESGYEKDKNW